VRDATRKLVALLIALRALTNLGKPFGAGSGFVVLGHLRHGAASSIAAPLFGVFMLVYAYGLWGARPYALPLGIAYAIWATLNIVLFPLVEGVPPQFAPALYVVYAVPGIAVPWLAVWLLRRRPSGPPKPVA
jgi:hypothetical protein